MDGLVSPGPGCKEQHWPTVATRRPAASGIRTHDLAAAGRTRQPLGYRVTRDVCVRVAAMQFYMRSSDVSAEIEEMKLEGKRLLPAGSEASTGVVTVGKLFKDPELRTPLFIACALAIIQQFSGINAVRRLSPIHTADADATQLSS